VALRGNCPEGAGTPPFQHVAAAALAVVLCGSWAVGAAAQRPPASQISEKIEPKSPPPPEEGNKDKFQREDGVIKPPSDIDQGMTIKPPNKGGTMPVIPPPGTPGDDENIKPK
jgi:hypothetical protein